MNQTYDLPAVFESITHLILDAGFALAVLTAAAAGFMRGFVGVGSGMLMAPIFAIIFGPVATVAIIVLMELAVTVQLLPGVRRLIAWRALVLPMGASAALCMPIGAWLLTTLSPDLMSRTIAAVVLVSVIVLMAGWRYTGSRKLAATLGVGSLSGVLMAATSLGNPPVMIYLLSGRDEAATNRANFTGYFAVTLIAMLFVLVTKSLIDLSVIARTAALLPVFMLGVWLGARYFNRSSEASYRRFACIVLLCVAVFGLIRQ